MRITCHRYGAGLDARASEVPHTERPGWLLARGWRRVGRDNWGRIGEPVTYSTAAAVREQLRASEEGNR